MPAQRLAAMSDAPAIARLMRESVRELFPLYYDARQTASGVEHIAHIDLTLIHDGTYFVHEQDGEVVACGGWSRRNKREEGFTSMVLLATLPGVPLYRSFGFRETGRVVIPMPDGVRIEGVAMERAITPAP